MAIDFVAIGAIIIDDIVDPQGRSNMGTLGGGASHAVAGMRVWSEQAALVSVIGPDFPETAWQQLIRLADTAGIVTRRAPQPRAWQLFEVDGTRREVFRTDFASLRQNIITPAEYPPVFAPAKGVYMQTATAAEAEAWAVQLRSLNPEVVLLWEPWEILYKPENLADFSRVAPLFDIISPQTAEVGWMLEETAPERQAALLFKAGVRCLALRMGASGSLVGTAAKQFHLPALQVPVVDETGAGNAYCGGVVVGYVESGGDPLVAGRYGAVSATFALAQVGLPRLGADSRVIAESRLNWFIGDLL
jgi:sugar/nucleoside kinase (ribokinase family)